MLGFPLQSGKSVEEVERAVLEEFGHCMRQIISSAQSGMSIETVTGLSSTSLSLTHSQQRRPWEYSSDVMKCHTFLDKRLHRITAGLKVVN